MRITSEQSDAHIRSFLDDDSLSDTMRTDPESRQ